MLSSLWLIHLVCRPPTILSDHKVSDIHRLLITVLFPIWSLLVTHSISKYVLSGFDFGQEFSKDDSKVPTILYNLPADVQS